MLLVASGDWRDRFRVSVLGVASWYASCWPRARASA